MFHNDKIVAMNRSLRPKLWNLNFAGHQALEKLNLIKLKQYAKLQPDIKIS